MSESLKIIWSDEAKADLRETYYNLLEKNSKEVAGKIRAEIFLAPESIVFPEQYQIDEYSFKYRRIVVKNFKIFYTHKDNIINIISVFNTHRHPSKIRG